MSASLASQLQKAVSDHAAGDLVRAEEGYLAVLRQQPHQADALHLLGVLRDQQGQHEAAVDLIRQALAQSPGEAAFHGNLGTALLGLGRADEAEAAYREAVRRDPAYAEGHYNLANLLRSYGNAEAACAAFETVLTIQPDHLLARNNLAMLLWEDIEDPDRASAEFARLLSLAPDWPVGHMNHGLFLLAAGQYEAGWQEYEWRWRNPDYAERDWGMGLPRWNGEPLQGPLLVWGEQGVGDQILYGSMIVDTMQRCGGGVIVAVDPRLVTLFRRSLADAGVTVVARGVPVQAVAQCPVASLGQWLRRSVPAFTSGRPSSYLYADDAATLQFASLYRDLAGPHRTVVGVSWRSGNTSIGHAKSIPLPDLLPALQTPGIFWVCLQYGDVAEELSWLTAHGVSMYRDPGVDAMRDMDRFASQVAALDRVVTVSNTAVHVAGALGVDCHLLLARGRGRLWYWPEEGQASLWYSSVKILRQREPSNWKMPIEQLRILLRESPVADLSR
jgi:Tfp pilus assembly protein PilF